MPLLYVARHGETTWNREGRYQGQRESDLTETGRRQASALASALARVGAVRVVASPLRRCSDTGRAVADVLGVPLEVDGDAIEIAHGTWEGRLRTEIEREDADTYALWREHPERVRFVGGESLRDVDERWRSLLRRLSTWDRDAVVVTHDVVVRLAILGATGRALEDFWSPRVANCGFARMRVSRDGTALEEECCDAHLEGLRTDAEKQAL